jgi:hypothetical protein
MADAAAHKRRYASTGLARSPKSGCPRAITSAMRDAIRDNRGQAAEGLLSGAILRTDSTVELGDSPSKPESPLTCWPDVLFIPCECI